MGRLGCLFYINNYHILGLGQYSFRLFLALKPSFWDLLSAQHEHEEPFSFSSGFFPSFKTHQIPNLISSITSLTSPPHPFAATHSISLKIFNPQTLSPSSTISSFSDVVSSASFRCDGLLIAASDLSGLIQVFDVKTRTPLRKLKSHTRPVRFLKYPFHDKLHLVFGGDDAVVKYWDVASGS
ncbi:hypothetical protein SO802_026790 [Lithocarpus litseifolius]|uniref:Uncharacterized protein n=1 Tax=Lithocarpus litseifolius TaxID=425828 RepID=A0AAW2C0J4_9ROSI